MRDDSTLEGLIRYAERLHQHVGDKHHVASPLGAWLLLALCAPLASKSTRSAFVDLLGADPMTAFDAATGLIDSPHPLVRSAMAVWNRPQFDTERLTQWQACLPRATETGDMPSQEELDEWTAQRTLGLIRHFPLEVTADDVVLLASALATKVSWEVPFTLAPAATLGPVSRWADSLDQVLASPPGDPRHDQFVTETKRAGIAIVHGVWARGGLRVFSVAAAPEVGMVDVLGAAYEIACSESAEQQSVQRMSLFDLEPGDGPLWLIREEEIETPARDGRAERCRAFLPAWSAESQMDLADQSLGFPVAAKGLADALGLEAFRYRAAQSANATYSRVGFEAAAVTGLAVALSKPRLVRGRLRTADLRFGHPYAVVAVSMDDDWRGLAGSGQLGPWHGTPVFSAWVTEPSEGGG